MRRLVAVMCALALVGGMGLSFTRANSAAVAAEKQPAVPYPSLEQVTNFDFMLGSYSGRKAAGENPKLVFGSSELNPEPAGSGHPGNLLSDGRYGMSAMAVGRAFCIDLWQAIEVGAFAQSLDDKRVVLVPSMQWFMCYRDPQKDFKASFSQGAFDAFLANEEISIETKRSVVNRMAEYGVDRKASLEAMRDEGSSVLSTKDPAEFASLALNALSRPAEMIDETAKRILDGVRLKLMMDSQESGKSEGDGGSSAGAGGSVATESRVSDASSGGSGESQKTYQDGASEPDWNEIFSKSEHEAKSISKNEFGVYDSWYKKNYGKWVKGANERWGFPKDGPFSPQEFEDFKLVLRVCKESGVRPLVLIQPAKGAVYDQTIYGKEVRARYYDMIREACQEAGVEVADFSGHEYDKYFLRDHSHPSSLGGAYYSKAIYEFFMKEE